MALGNDIKDQSQLDPGGVLKSAHSDEARALRTIDANSLAKDNYSHFSVTYDGSDNPTEVVYKLGTEAEISHITCVADVSFSLNDTYFYLNGGRNSQEFYVWYNVGSTGTDPAIAGKIGIEVAIAENDLAVVVALATKLMIEAVAPLYFNIYRDSGSLDVLRIKAIAKGITDDTTDAGSTGFTFLTQNQGAETILDTVTISYNGTDPVWQGVELTGYVYNIFTGKFELVSSGGGGGAAGDTIENPSGYDAAIMINQGPYAYQHVPNIIDTIIGATAYDEVSTAIVGNVETVTYSYLGAPVKGVQITYSDNTWAIVEVNVIFDYILLEDGDLLLQENGDRLILEA